MAVRMRERPSRNRLSPGLAVARRYQRKKSVGWNASEIPIVDFVAYEGLLDRPLLYPRQATFLKILFLQDWCFTDYDHQVIGEWIEAWEASKNADGYGNNGIQPDIYERIEINKEAGRPWFRETLPVFGRRGSKGHLGGLAGSFVLWRYLGMVNPQERFGIDRDKRMGMYVFAGKKDQAKANQWKDLVHVIKGGPCFEPYLSRSLGESLTLFSPDDIDRYESLGWTPEESDDLATFEILPKESTTMSGRGPATFAQFYDEMAHVVAATARATAEEVYGSATPALDTFGKFAFLYEPSSPWQQTGQFYENWKHSLERDEVADKPVYPEMFMAQLTSWDIYKDWEHANDLVMRGEVSGRGKGLRFIEILQPVQVYDDQMQQLERANPETFSVERRSHWAASLNAYLHPDKIAEVWRPWPTSERLMVQQVQGILTITYRAHGDPSKSGANFGFAVAHIEGPDRRGLPHVVFDRLHAWLPEDYEDHIVDYDEIGEDLEDFIERFMPTELTFDQFNSVSTIQRLQKYARRRDLPKSITIYERPATNPLNWKTYETFKTAMGMGLVHAPFYELANQELTFLQDNGGKVEPPTSGPVQTKDVADCMAIVTYELIGDQMAAFIGKTLAELPLVGGGQGGMKRYAGRPEQEEAHEKLSGFGRARRHPGSGTSRRRR